MFVLRTGDRWARNLRAPVLGNPTVNIEKPGTALLPTIVNFDIRVEKTFTFKGDLRLGFLLDVYNAFNLGYETRLVSRVTSPSFGKADRDNYGRLYQASIRIYF